MKKINLMRLAGLIAAAQQCKEGFKQPAIDAIDELCELLPHGSGLDAGVKIDMTLSAPEKITFTFEFHHLNEDGYYDGWTSHHLIITPSLQHGFNIRISGRDRNDIKEYLYQIFSDVFYMEPVVNLFESAAK